MIETDPSINFDLGDLRNKILQSTDPQIIDNLNLKLPANNPLNCDSPDHDSYLKRNQELFSGSDSNLIKVDILVESDRSTAQRTTQFQKMAAQHYPSLSLLVVLLKYFLHIRGLNIPYNGGLTSYAIVLLVIAYLDHTNNTTSKNYRELFMG
jgi:hypothetical protein